MCIVASLEYYGNYSLYSTCTGFAFRFEHRKWNRGRNGLLQLEQPVAPSVPFPVFNPEGEPGTCTCMSCILDIFSKEQG